MDRRPSKVGRKKSFRFKSYKSNTMTFKHAKKKKRMRNFDSDQSYLSLEVHSAEVLRSKLRRLLKSSKSRCSVIRFVGTMQLDKVLLNTFTLSEKDRKSADYWTMYNHLTNQGFLLENPPLEFPFNFITNGRRRSSDKTNRSENSVPCSIEESLSALFDESNVFSSQCSPCNQMLTPKPCDKKLHSSPVKNYNVTLGVSFRSNSSNTLFPEDFKDSNPVCCSGVKLEPTDLMILEDVLNIEEELCSQSSFSNNIKHESDKDKALYSPDRDSDLFYAESNGSCASSSTVIFDRDLCHPSVINNSTPNSPHYVIHTDVKMETKESMKIKCKSVGIEETDNLEVVAENHFEDMSMKFLDEIIAQPICLATEEDFFKSINDAETEYTLFSSSENSFFNDNAPTDTEDSNVYVSDNFFEVNNVPTVPSLYPTVQSNDAVISKLIPKRPEERKYFEKFKCKPSSVRIMDINKRLKVCNSSDGDEKPLYVVSSGKNCAERNDGKLTLKKPPRNIRPVVKRQYYMDAITLELSSEKPNKANILMAMKETFSLRRRYIDKYTALEMVQEFQALEFYEVMKAEICNYFPTESNIMSTLEEKLVSYLTEALAQNPACFPKKPIAATAIKLSHDVDVSEEKKKVLGMVVLSFQYCKSIASLCTITRAKNGRYAPKRLTPVMNLEEDEMFQTNADIWIYADGKKILKVPNFYEGVLTIYSMHYAFNMVYDSGLKPFFEYFDFLLNIPQSTYQPVTPT